MTDPSDKDVDLDLDHGTTYVTQICTPKFRVLLGEDLALLVFETLEGATIKVPVGVTTLSGIWQEIGEALSELGPEREDTLQ